MNELKTSSSQGYDNLPEDLDKSPAKSLPTGRISQLNNQVLNPWFGTPRAIPGTGPC